MTGSTLVVLLAAGAGTRWAGPGHKLDAELTPGGPTVAEQAAGAADEAAVGDVVVVTGAHHPRLPAGIEQIHNPRWAEGQRSSLLAAIDLADDRGVDAIVVGLADQPFVDAEAWRRVAASEATIAVATYGGRRRNPVRLARRAWALLPHDGDVGARDLIRLRPDLVEEVPCPGSPADIDTWEDLQQWQSRSSTNSP